MSLNHQNALLWPAQLTHYKGFTSISNFKWCNTKSQRHWLIVKSLGNTSGNKSSLKAPKSILLISRLLANTGLWTATSVNLPTSIDNNRQEKSQCLIWPQQMMIFRYKIWLISEAVKLHRGLTSEYSSCRFWCSSCWSLLFFQLAS